MAATRYPTHNYTDGAVDYSGLLRNLLNDTFNTKDCIGELIDNSLGAGATRIWLHIDSSESKLYFIDNGAGMSKEEAGNSIVLHKRSCSSEKKAGCFGIGLKHAIAQLTQNAGKMQLFTKLAGDSADNITEMEVNFKQAIETGKPVINPHDISRKGYENVWEPYAYSGELGGTIMVFELPEEILEELTNALNTTEIEHSLRYFIGSRYYHILNDGITVDISLDDGNTYEVVPDDSLMWDEIEDEEDKQEIRLKVYYNSNNKRVVVYYMNDNGDKGFRNFDKTKTGKWIAGKPSGEYEDIGSLLLRSVYSDNWAELKKTQLKANNIKIKYNKKDGKPNRDFMDQLNGTRIIRNGRVIQQFPTPGIKSGDHELRKFTYNTLCNVSYTADETMDRLFKLNINKSNLEQDGIHPNILNTIMYLHNEFVKKRYRVHFPAPNPESDSESEHEIPAPVVPEPAPVAPEPAPVAPEPAPVAPAPAPVAPAPAPVAPAPAPVGPAPTPAPNTSLQPKPKPVSVPDPVAPLKPIPSPTPITHVKFSKTSENVIINNNKTGKSISIPYKGQYHVTEQYYSQHLLELGDDRFMEWAAALLILNQKYFNNI